MIGMWPLEGQGRRQVICRCMAFIVIAVLTFSWTLVIDRVSARYEQGVN